LALLPAAWGWVWGLVTRSVPVLQMALEVCICMALGRGPAASKTEVGQPGKGQDMDRKGDWSLTLSQELEHAGLALWLKW
jgi:hypothetical protein